MKKLLKIAVYSGEIPSTTFIERLILGLAKENYKILLFGVLKTNISYPYSVTVVGYTHHRVLKLLHYLKYSLLLMLFRRQDKKKLDGMLQKNILYSKVKFYPVLWHRPDIFHLQWAKGVEEWSWVQAFGIKLVLSLRGAHINYSPIADSDLADMYRGHFPKVDGFHAVSKAIAKEALLYGANPEKIKVVYSGLKLQDFQSPMHRDTEVFQIVSVGRPHWIKGYNYALDACKLLKQQNFKFKYSIIGGSSDIELLYQLEDLNIQDEVKLLGYTAIEDVFLMMRSADLLVVSSMKEGIANVVLEAMALGTMVLTTDCGGMTELVIHNVNGFVVPIRNAERMAEAILTIAQLTEDKRSVILKNAYETIARDHTEAQMVEGMRGLYDKVIKD